MNGKQLKNSILQWAIQGKIVPQDPNDEPASVLLERIREEKKRLIKEGKIKKDKNESFIFKGDDNSYYEKFADGKVICIDEEIPFEIPAGWEWSRIREISQSYIGLTYNPGDVSEEGTIVLRSSNIKNGKLILDDIVRVKKDIPSKLWVETNDILICARNGSAKLVGKSAIIPESNERMTFGAFMAICKTALYEYVFIFLQSDLFFGQLRQVSGTTTINQLTQNNFNGFLIPVPPLEEQKRISNKLSIILPEVEIYSKAQDKLDSLNYSLSKKIQQAILNEAIQGRLVPQDPNDVPASILLEKIVLEKQGLVKEGKIKPKDAAMSIIFKGEDNKYYEKIGGKVVEITDEIPYDLPQGWQWTRLSNIASITAGGTPERSTPTYWNGDIPWLKISDITSSDKYVRTASEYITREGMNNSSAKLMRKGTILYTIFASIGEVGILDFDSTCNQAIAGISLYCESMQEFLYYYLVNLKSFMLSVSQGCAQLNINQKILKSALVPLPPVEEQKRIVNRINVLFDMLH